EEWDEAEQDVQSAMATIQHARRTLKEARQKQNNVKLARQYFRTNSGANNRDYNKNRDEKMVCLRCGRTGHRVANCPDPPTASAKSAEVTATTSFVCFSDEAQAMMIRSTDTDPQQAMAACISTADAVDQGKAVIDGGATKTLASVAAMERIMHLNNLKKGDTGLVSIDLSERPVFGFGNGSEDRCSSTVKLRIDAASKPGEVKVHCLDKGNGPMLLSIDTLRKLKAIIDFESDLICFRALDEDMRTDLAMLGEAAPMGWTKVELGQRLRELREQGIADSEAPTALTSMEKMLKDLRKASKLKSTLTTFCTQVLHLELTGNEVMSKMIDKATKEIHRVCPPESHDYVGFGKHADERYVTIATQYHEYANWVKVTFRENGEEHVDPRLARLAKWLIDQEQKPEPKVKAAVRKDKGYMKMRVPDDRNHSPGRHSGSRSSTDPTPAQTMRMMTQMAEALESVRQELAEVKGERPRKTAGRAEEGSVTDSSFSVLSGSPQKDLDL
ncbi:unnamed protein product, partial [Symbiodinium sp. CCMP2456]